MNKMTLLFLFILGTYQISLAQNTPYYESYGWTDIHDENISSYNEDIVELSHNIITEFYFEQENKLIEYFLEHKVILLNSDDAIEEFNKVYIPYSQSSQIIINKARVITKSNEVVELDNSKILSAEDEETGRQYTYFAFEGVEKGSIIDYYYVIKKRPEYLGKRITLQSSNLKKNISFELYAPKHLEFSFKSYNGLPTVERDSLLKEKAHWKVSSPEILALENETVAAYQASKGFIIYKLDKNLVSNKSNFAAYGKTAQNIYSYYNVEYSGSTKKLLTKFIKESTEKVNDTDKEALVRSLETHIKTNVFLSYAGGDELKDLDAVLTKKVASEAGMLMLYVAVLKTLDIPHELVITSDRRKLKFDNTFEAQNFLTDFLIYFPESKLYLAPMEAESRYGFPPAHLTDNYGLFIKEVAIGNFKSGIGKVKYINGIKAEETFDKMILDVSFDDNDLTKNRIKLDRSFSGYHAVDIQPYMHLVKTEDRNNIIDQFAKSLNENVSIKSKSIVNDDPSLFGLKPLQFLLDFESEAFVEKAGNKYLFQVGSLIGEQIQMYQEKTRVLPVESDYNRSYYRTINITIPNGYKISNLDDININNSFEISNKKILSFHSFYEIKDNILKITADEHYRQNIIKVSNFEEYRKVINSAADFNKVTLVLEPIK